MLIACCSSLDTMKISSFDASICAVGVVRQVDVQGPVKPEGLSRLRSGLPHVAVLCLRDVGREHHTRYSSTTCQSRRAANTTSSSLPESPAQISKACRSLSRSTVI